MAFTEQFLGKKAVAKLLKTMSSDSIMTSFTMSKGVHCELKENKCTTSKLNDTPDLVATSTLLNQ